MAARPKDHLKKAQQSKNSLTLYVSKVTIFPIELGYMAAQSHSLDPPSYSQGRLEKKGANISRPRDHETTN